MDSCSAPFGAKGKGVKIRALCYGDCSALPLVVRYLCGNTSEPSYVSASFGESCLFLLSGSKRVK